MLAVLGVLPWQWQWQRACENIMTKKKKGLEIATRTAQVASARSSSLAPCSSLLTSTSHSNTSSHRCIFGCFLPPPRDNGSHLLCYGTACGRQQ
jgi:hypothetical protein